MVPSVLSRLDRLSLAGNNLSGMILFELSRFGEDDFVANNGLAIKLQRMLGFDGGYD